MENRASNSSGLRSKAPAEQPQKKTDFQKTVEAASFLVTLGMLILMSGVICISAFQNGFGMYLFEAGFVLAIFGVGVKVIDILLKIIAGRS